MIYLAFQFTEEDISLEQLGLIMDNYYDFQSKNSRYPKNFADWYSWAQTERKENIRRGREAGLDVKEFEDLSPLGLGSLFATQFLVRGHPTLEIYLRDNQVKQIPYCPNDFSGLNIWPGHSGSEGMVDLIQFSPEISAFLTSIGLNYIDRSFTEI